MQPEGPYTKVQTIATIIGIIITFLAYIDIAPRKYRYSYIENDAIQGEHKIAVKEYKYNIKEHKVQFIDDAKVNISVIFQSYGSQEFVTLNICPLGKKSYSYAVLNGYTKEFKSFAGDYDINILNIDYINKVVSVQVYLKK